MFILDINKKIKKIITVYLCLSIFLIVFDRVYSIFSHGVSSANMYLMFLYPLLGGSLVYLIIGLLTKKHNYNKLRISFNIYNSGIAFITIGSLLHGIMDIAGTSSEYLIIYTIVGWGTIIFAIIIMIIKYFKK